MLAQVNRAAIRRRVRHRVRKKISGTAARPRLAVFRSVRHVYAQAIDDENGRTVAFASTQGADQGSSKGWNCEAATHVGVVMAGKLKEAGIHSLVFDRGGFNYHGRIKALADDIFSGRGSSSRLAGVATSGTSGVSSASGSGGCSTDALAAGSAGALSRGRSKSRPSSAGRRRGISGRGGT